MLWTSYEDRHLKMLKCSDRSAAFPINKWHQCTITITTVLRPFFWDHPGEPVPDENFWTLWCKGRLTDVDTPTIRLGATPSGLSSAHLHHCPISYMPDALPAAQPTVSQHWRQLAYKAIWNSLLVILFVFRIVSCQRWNSYYSCKRNQCNIDHEVTGIKLDNDNKCSPYSQRSSTISTDYRVSAAIKQHSLDYKGPTLFKQKS